MSIERTISSSTVFEQRAAQGLRLALVVIFLVFGLQK